jgi:xanthine dehydrogenase YagS FAD-binding subunit
VRPFRYLRPPDTAAALAAAGSPGAAFLGGGTTLVDLMRLDVEAPREVVDVSRIAADPERRGGVYDTPDGLCLAASARNSDVAMHPLVRRRYPVLSEALLSGASPQIRNMATVGGNLLQRTRCAYFRDVGVEACNKRRPGSGCAAQDGWSRMHAILGASERCIAVHPSDMCVALVALDADVHTHRAQGTRVIPAADLHLVPGEHPERETILEPGELITHVTLPDTPFAAHSHYVKVRDRAAFAFALASAAVALELGAGKAPGGSRIRQARVALGGVATKPWRCREVEAALVDNHPSRALFEHAAALAVKGAKTRADNAFKTALVQRAIVRALERAAGEPV